MKAEANSIARSEKPVRPSTIFSRALPATKTLESRKPAARHPSRMQSPLAAEMREIGLTLHEIVALADIMREAYGNGDWESLRHRLAVLMSKAGTLEAALSDVMEHSTTEKEPVDKNCKCFDIVVLLHEACEAARSALKDKPVTVMNVSCPDPVLVYSDSTKIRQILMCLMSNAAKFTTRGRIALILGRDDDRIRLTVADTGKGMAPEQINAVLKPADGVFGAEMNGFATSGSRLGIVKDLVTKLEGGISISSKLGEGTIVEVCLPLEPL